jgi:hypothetical protein
VETAAQLLSSSRQDGEAVEEVLSESVVARDDRISSRDIACASMISQRS